jgi:peptidoglycan pentaglycine glycine transferase (the first glycine)
MTFRDKWNQFIAMSDGSFLQSYEWGEFQQSLGRKIWRIEEETFKGLVIKHDLPLSKNYLYCPRSLAFKKSFLKKLKKIAQEEESIFLKIEPQENFRLPAANFRLSPSQVQPGQTLILDISGSSQELLKQMGQKTRYNIKLAQKKGIVIEEDNTKIGDFLKLLKKTAKRDNFQLHPQEYYQKMISVLGPKSSAKLFLAKYQKKIIAANLTCFFGRTAIYLHGASDYRFRQMMAPYLLQWQSILEAKKQGFRFYDFWGIDEEKWPGITRFKKGFGGIKIIYPGSFDLVFQPAWYKIYQIARRIL